MPANDSGPASEFYQDMLRQNLVQTVTAHNKEVAEYHKELNERVNKRVAEAGGGDPMAFLTPDEKVELMVLKYTQGPIPFPQRETFAGARFTGDDGAVHRPKPVDKFLTGGRLATEVIVTSRLEDPLVVPTPPGQERFPHTAAELSEAATKAFQEQQEAKATVSLLGDPLSPSDRLYREMSGKAKAKEMLREGEEAQQGPSAVEAARSMGAVARGEVDMKSAMKGGGRKPSPPKELQVGLGDKALAEAAKELAEAGGEGAEQSQEPPPPPPEQSQEEIEAARQQYQESRKD